MNAARRYRKPVALVCGIALCASISGCQWTGLNSLPLPGTKGHGPGSYHVIIEMPDVTTITTNAPVLVHDVEVGSITAITTENWHAKVTVTLARDAALPANTTAKIGQTSLLGTTHIELDAPTAPEGTLADGSVIPLDRAGEYPTTEQTLAALSMVLTGGGLGNLQMIVSEADKAVAGHQASVVNVLDQMNTLLGELDSQRRAITTTLQGLDRFADRATRDNDTIGKALDSIGPAIDVLARQRGNLTTALSALSRFGNAGTALVNQIHGDLKQNLTGLVPLLEKISEAGDDLVNNIHQLATFPFPPIAVQNGVRGDYMNLWAEADLTLSRLQKGLLFGTPLAGPNPTAPPPGAGR
ncbi:MCE family protein [Nocardia vaccinii]|uniref:MCE family protein n=1 Tax=Nocardia vaccinii TaxID=1822 RepID=UPI000833BC81|nr:MCE family protein [Nocardia vaccinii]